MYARVYMRARMIVWTPQDTRPAHDRNTHRRNTTTGKGRNTGKAEKPAYICMIADNEKKYKKVKKKFVIKKKGRIFAS